jgi:threonine synthase
MDGMSMEPAAATAFAGLFQMVSEGRIRRDDVVVVNCSGHTFPVEKFLLGDDWERSVDLEQAGGHGPAGHEEGILASLEHLSGRTKKIAIIEDNVDSARLLRRVLQAQGEYQIAEAHDGRAGLAMVRQDPPDLILLDLMMPELDGFGVIDALKRDQQLRDVPVIVVTAAELSTAEKGRLQGHVRTTLQKGTFLSTDITEDINRVLREEDGT